MDSVNIGFTLKMSQQCALLFYHRRNAEDKDFDVKFWGIKISNCLIAETLTQVIHFAIFTTGQLERISSDWENWM